MSFNKEVCKAFFSFGSHLNKGHGIISSIYGLINRKRSQDETYFAHLQERIEREAATCSGLESFYELLLLCWKNLPDGTSKWSMVALMFFTTDIVDKIARTKLETHEYKWFKIHAEELLCHELDLKYGDSLTEYAWDIFNIQENTIELAKKPLPILDIICCSVFVYSVYKLV